MDNNFTGHGNTVSGTIGGTIYVLLLQVSFTEISRTIFLAALGASVSFLVSLFLKWLIRRLRK